MLKKSVILLLAGSLLAACTTTNPYTGEQQVSKTAGGAAIGAGLGALGGLFVGGSRRAKRNAVLTGAGVGALGGGVIGNYMDRQEAELRAQLQGTGVSVTRSGDQVILNLPGNITFGTDRDGVKPQFYETLDSVAVVLKKYDQSLVNVVGHTDSTGSAAHNQDLSERRALSVAQYLNGRGIDGRRLAVIGQGMGKPVATNATEAGRALNRRVEIRISPLRAG
ncbi:MAG: OmpA family protein [Candidatus Tokpelaia hoelldobleri]|uniref:OmpA family protein n=1 Tax=Candidatus Tokpelaia hoelldobleri TaxID=1902579 RepID=A0A1U9JUF3_9HYPH|nr:MAG: OmpA family protein [Candidatus Tokpelaia hoelldoblerii]